MDIKAFWHGHDSIDLDFDHKYVYRCVLTNDWNNSENDIIAYYNKRGASERNFDCQKNVLRQLMENKGKFCLDNCYICRL